MIALEKVSFFLQFLKSNQNLQLHKSIHSTAKLFKIQPPENSPLNIFDRSAKIFQKERALLLHDVDNYDYIKQEIGERLSDRVFDIKKNLDTVLDLGCGRGYVARHISSDNVKNLISCDISKNISLQSYCDDHDVTFKSIEINEERITDAIQPNTVDLVISNLSLHWVNNLPQCFNEVMKVLKNDGVFMASIFGGDTLYELRSSLQLAELERLGGLSPHISPFARIRDVGGLLTRSGYTMQTIDTEEIIVGYPSMIDLMLDLKGMGENNASWNRKLHLRRDIITAASSIYSQLYGKEVDGRFSYPATYQIIYLLGWKPDPSQPQPLGRGTGEISLKDLHKLDEIIKEKGTIPTEER